MVGLKELTDYCNKLLDVDRFSDYCPNGLHVEGRAEVRSIISGVTANQALIDAATEKQADVLLVHHGFFWKGEDTCITGMKQRRIKALLKASTSLLAYHLPLDAHPQLGNNAQLAERLGLIEKGRFGCGYGPDLACFAELEPAVSSGEIIERIEQQLGRKPLHIVGGSDAIQTIGWCTGAAQSFFEAAAKRGLDAFISGEISEPTVHIAREYGIHYFSAGHHATERYGVQALGEHLAAQFGLQYEFIDIDNPV